MSATDSERTRKRGRVYLGISGRIPSERVADLRRNQWPDWVGIRILILCETVFSCYLFELRGHKGTGHGMLHRLIKGYRKLLGKPRPSTKKAATQRPWVIKPTAD